MSRITDYGFYFKQHLELIKNKFGQQYYSVVQNEQQLPIQKQLKAAGIDTSSKKYKAALVR